MPKQTASRELYRPCVGVAIFNPKGQVWIGKRAGETGPYIWQFPQGGIDPGETPEYAAIRELEEETGISVQSVAPLGQSSAEFFYDYPEDVQKNSRTRKWRGQRQIWYALRFVDDNSWVNINAQQPAEFSEWKWGDLTDTPNLIVPFKRKVYEQLVIEFADFANPVK